MYPQYLDPYLQHGAQRVAEDQAAARRRRLARRPHPPGRWRRPVARALVRTAERLVGEPLEAIPRRA